MKRSLTAGAASLCVLAFTAMAWPSPGIAGGYGLHHGFGHHGFHGHRHYGFRHFGFRRGFGFHRHHHHGGYWVRPRGYYESPWHDDEPEPVYREPEVVAEPLPAPAATSCLQVREYQTQIYVGGKPVQAYGRACLQPDGDWSYEVPETRE